MLLAILSFISRAVVDVIVEDVAERERTKTSLIKAREVKLDFAENKGEKPC